MSLFSIVSGQAVSDDSNSSSGLAIPDSVCTDRAVAVITTSAVEVPQLASVVSHMIGHIIGLKHDAAGKIPLCL